MDIEDITPEDIDAMSEEELEEFITEHGRDDEEEEPQPSPLNLTVNEGETKESVIAKMSLKPEYHAAATMSHIESSQFGDDSPDINALISELEKQTELIRKQDLSTADAMLASQAHMLDNLFYRLIRRAEANSNSGYLDAATAYMKLAMRAQAQCRTTWETAAKIKNPPVIVKQQNVAHNQQINNGGEIENPPSKLLEKTHVQRLDTRTPGEAVNIDPAVAAVEMLNRAENG